MSARIIVHESKERQNKEEETNNQTEIGNRKLNFCHESEIIIEIN